MTISLLSAVIFNIALFIIANQTGINKSQAGTACYSFIAMSMLWFGSPSLQLHMSVLDVGAMSLMVWASIEVVISVISRFRFCTLDFQYNQRRIAFVFAVS